MGVIIMGIAIIIIIIIIIIIVVIIIINVTIIIILLSYLIDIDITITVNIGKQLVVWSSPFCSEKKNIIILRLKKLLGVYEPQQRL